MCYVEKNNSELIKQICNEVCCATNDLVFLSFIIDMDGEEYPIFTYQSDKVTKVSREFTIDKIGKLVVTKTDDFLLSDKLYFQEVVNKIKGLWQVKESKYNYAFFQNKDCEYFPCHDFKNIDSFNCLFCYCPLYLMEDCKGNYTYTEGGIKNCTECLIPHLKDNYSHIIKKLYQK